MVNNFIKINIKERNENIDRHRFEELIKIADQKSKEDFLRFVKGIYHVDESVFEHILEVPVIPQYGGDILVTTPLSTKTEDEILDIVDNFIASELGNADGCFISLSKMESEFSPEELEECKKKVDNGEIKLNYNAIIIYNESTLQEQYKELIKDNATKKQPHPQEDVDQIFMNYVKEVITHERCHLNANYLITEKNENQEENKEKRKKEIVSEINGAEIKIDGDGLLTLKYSQRNDVLLDVLSRMMHDYKEGDSIEDCLLKVIKKRDGESMYEEFDDSDVLIMYVLFPEELAEWATFGAYDFVRVNKLQQMFVKVYGTDEVLEYNQLRKKTEEYILSLEDGTLSEKQLEMLEMLGISTSKKIDKKDMEELAKSDETMGILGIDIGNINAFITRIQGRKNDSQEK